MRSRLFPLLVVAFTVACADVPTGPPTQPPNGFLAFDGKAPPPWAEISGEITTDGDGILLSLSPLLSRVGAGGASFSHIVGGDAATYVGWLLVTPGEQAAILRFAEGGANVTFSSGAAIMEVKGKVSGRGTMTVGGHLYYLSSVTKFDFDGDCATTPWEGWCASFEGDGFSSEASVWTGVLSSDGGGPDFEFPPGWDYCRHNDCVCIDCWDVVTHDLKGRGR